jgi:ABC-type sugar transport system ATPase subunit
MNLNERVNEMPILEMRGISKSFGHVQALNDVDFEVYPHEVLALVGDNGAGKSTLVKVLSGVYSADRGSIQIDGKPVAIRSPFDAQQLGIATVYQDLALVDCRDIAANIFLGREPTRGIIVNRKKMIQESEEVLGSLKIKLPSVTVAVGFLSGGQRQAVAIARAISRGGRILILDEPTAALGIEESQKVNNLISDLKARGSSVVIISHNLAHVFSVADRIFVLRHGQRVGTCTKQDTTMEQIVGMITGAIQAEPVHNAVSPNPAGRSDRSPR